MTLCPCRFTQGGPLRMRSGVPVLAYQPLPCWLKPGESPLPLPLPQVCGSSALWPPESLFLRVPAGCRARSRLSLSGSTLYLSVFPLQWT